MYQCKTNTIHTRCNRAVAVIQSRVSQAKNWNLYSVKDDQIAFSYNQNEYTNSAESFITIYSFINEGESQNWVNVEFNSKEKYNDYIAKIKSYGCKLIDSEMTEDGFKKVYQGITTTFSIEISASEDRHNNSGFKYYFLIVNNTDYILIKWSEEISSEELTNESNSADLSSSNQGTPAKTIMKGKLRSSPTALESNVILVIPANESVKLIKKVDDYWVAEYNNRRGYLNEVYIQK